MQTLCPDKIQTKHRQTQLHKDESLFFVKGMLVAPLLTVGLSDGVAQELQMPIGPQMLDDMEEPMPARPATFRDLGTPDHIVLEQHSLTHFPSQPCARCASHLEDVIHSIEKEQKNVDLKDKTSKLNDKCHRHRAIKATEQLRKPSPQCVD